MEIKTLRIIFTLRTIFFLLACISCFSLSGQIERPDRPDRPDRDDEFGEFELGEGEETDSLKEEIELILPDTTIIDYSYFDEFHRLRPFSDTLFTSNSQLYDPAQTVYHQHAHLGTMGSASWSLAYKENRKTGVDLGYDHYTIYHLQKDSFRLYKVNRPVTAVFFMPSGNQQNFLINTKFARNFANNVNVSLDYQRIKQPGEYLSQETKSTYVGGAISYTSPKKKFDFIISVTSNSNNELNNGGITDKSLFFEPFYNFRERIPVLLSGASTRQTYRNYSLNNYYHLVQIEGSPWKFSLRHELSYIRQGFRSSDDEVDSSTESAFYMDLLVDTRGLRNRMSANSLQNSFFLILDNVSGFNAQASLSYANYSIDLDGRDFGKNVLQANFLGNWSFKKTLKLETQAKIHLLDYIGDIDLNAKLSLNTKKFGTIRGFFHFNRSSPSLLHQELYISQSNIWKNDYAKPILSSIGAEYELPSIGLHASIRQSLVDKPLYFDENANSRQLEGSLAISAIRIQENFKFKIFHFDNVFEYQFLDQDIYPLPAWFSSHSFYLRTRLFKKQMDFKTGVDVRLIESYFQPAYMPLLGQFHMQSTDQADLFAITDYFVNFKISRFETFLRLENVTYLMGNKVFYQVYNYPQFDFRIKLGVRWSLFD